MFTLLILVLQQDSRYRLKKVGLDRVKVAVLYMFEITMQ